MGTHVVSGSARALVVATGQSTEFGKVSERLRSKPAETEFEHGVRRFGYLLTEVTLVLVIVIFGITIVAGSPIVDSFCSHLLLLSVSFQNYFQPSSASIWQLGQCTWRAIK